MNKVINLADNKPHISGEIKCFGCQHKWMAVSPIGTKEFECPKCGTLKGRAIFECIRKDFLHWTCDCGNDLFSITPKHIYCPNCGKSHTGMWDD